MAEIPDQIPAFSLSLFLVQNSHNDGQRYSFYRTVGIWSTYKNLLDKKKQTPKSAIKTVG